MSTATARAYRSLRRRGIVRTYGRGGTTVAERRPVAHGLVPTPPPGLYNLIDGNPDPKLLPPLGWILAKSGDRGLLYGDPLKLPELSDWCWISSERRASGRLTRAVPTNGRQRRPSARSRRNAAAGC